MENSSALLREVLIVSATPLIRDLLHNVFLTAHYQCVLTANGAEAIEKFRQWQPSLVVADFNLPDMCGNELLQDVRREGLDTAAMILCGGVLKRGGRSSGSWTLTPSEGPAGSLVLMRCLRSPCR
jgi:chemotaxis response regulator CheB